MRCSKARFKVNLAGLNYAVTYHKPRNSPELLAKSLPLNEDHNASMTQGEFLALAWRAAKGEGNWVDPIEEALRKIVAERNRSARES